MPNNIFLQPKIIFIISLFLMATVANAQLCNGNLGDPVVNITFGAGPNPGPPLPAASTNYLYVGNDCPNDGSYTVRNSSTACFGDSWYTVTKDHTGDGNGYFMLVNASFFPGTFYIDTIRGLCPNTTFEFAAWVMNILKNTSCLPDPKEPNLTFNIETTNDSVLQTFSTGDLPAGSAPIWKQYGFIFRTPQGISDIVVRIINNAPGGCGNDIALDDITFRPCGPSVTANIIGSGSTKDLCVGDNAAVTLKSDVSAGYNNPAYQWQVSNDGFSWTDIAGATAVSFVRTTTGTGTYYYRLAVAEAGNINSAKCRVVSNTVTVTVHGVPVTNASSNSPVCEDATLNLTASGGSTFKWTGPGNFTATGNPATRDNINSANAGKYYVTVTTDIGCSQKDSVNVSVIPKPTADAGADVNICEGASTILHGSGGANYFWSPNTTLSDANAHAPVATPTDSTVYILTVTANNGCTDKDSVAVNVYRKPFANAGPDKIMIEGGSVQLDATVAGTNINYFWTPNIYINNINIAKPTVSPPQDFTYTLHVISNLSCGIATDDVFVKVYKKVIVPNAFSPNGDGINDTWNIEALEAYPDATLIVYNRYGQAVFHSTSYPKQWDGTYNGKPLPVGTYYYVIDLKFNNMQLNGYVLILH